MSTPSEVRRACAKVLSQEDLEPHDGNTYCNIALHAIMLRLGLPDFCINESRAVMMANEIADKLESTCKELNFAEAFEAANAGGIVVAAMKMPMHGHVALLYPFPGLYASGKWQRWDVPCVANVGGVDGSGESMNGVRPINWCFGSKPRLWLVRE